MENLCLTFCGFNSKPYVSIDDNPIKISKKQNTYSVSLQVASGEHEITICEKHILCKWYWWILLLNILYPLLCFRGFSGKQAGYDGECVASTFKIVCSDQCISNIKFVKKENSHSKTPLNANFNSLSLQSNLPIHIKSDTLDSKKAFRLKLTMIFPFILLTAIFSCAWGYLLLQNNMSLYDTIVFSIFELAIIVYTMYKIYKIKTQKSFSELSKISRIDISVKKK